MAAEKWEEGDGGDNGGLEGFGDRSTYLGSSETERVWISVFHVLCSPVQLDPVLCKQARPGQ